MAKKPAKTSLSIGLEFRELLRAVADYTDTTMEKVVVKTVHRYVDSLVHNPNSIVTYNALHAPLRASRSASEARNRNISGRSRHMQKLNQQRRQSVKRERAEIAENPPLRRPLPASYPGVFGTITDETREPSERTKRRMIGGRNTPPPITL